MAYPAPPPHLSKPPKRASLLLADLKGLFVKPEQKGIGFTYDPRASSSSLEAGGKGSGGEELVDASFSCMPTLSFEAATHKARSTKRNSTGDDTKGLGLNRVRESKLSAADSSDVKTSEEEDEDVVIIGWHAVTYILPSPQLPNPIALDLDYVFVDRHPPLRPVSALSVADITFEVPYEFATPAQQEKRWVESWFREKLRTNLGFAEGVRKGLYGVETVAV